MDCTLPVCPKEDYTEGPCEYLKCTYLAIDYRVCGNCKHCNVSFKGRILCESGTHKLETDSEYIYIDTGLPTKACDYWDFNREGL